MSGISDAPARASMLPPPQLAVGRVLGGRYRLVNRIGIGGVGEVWEAEDAVLGRTVAVKAVAAHVSREQFEREARMAASISHPNVATVHDFGVDDGTPYLVMERAPGTPLASLLHGRPLPIETVVPVLTQVADALDAAHRAGVVHRDVKPGNVVVDATGSRPRVKLTDFGIATTQADRMRDRSGTPHYMAPEQVTGKRAVPASDVYALGVVAFELLAGNRPFGGDSPEAIAASRLSGDPPSLPDTVPLAMRSLVRSAMDVDSSRRPDAATFARRMRSFSTGPRLAMAATATHVDGPVTRTEVYPSTPRPRRAWWWLAAALTGLLLFVGIVVAAQGDPILRDTPDTIPPTAPAATIAPTTVTPGAEGDGGGNGNSGENPGNGNGKGKDKDD